MVEHSDHTVTMKPNSRANFAPLQGSKFEEAFYLTLRRDQEAGKKKYLKQKYRGVRSDSQARKKRQRQEKKKNKRLAKGKQLKSKDIIDKTHDQFALTWGMMMGVQMSVGRQFEFSAKASSKSMNVDGKDSQNNKDSSTKVEGGNGNANEESPSHPKGLETKVSSTGSIDSHSSATSLSRKRNNSMQQAKELSMHMGVSAAVDEQTGELVTTPSMNEIRRQSQYSKHKTNGADLTAFTKAGGGAADTDTVSTTAVSTSTTATADSGDAVADKGSNKSTRRRPSNLRGDMDMFADSLKVTDFMAVDKYIFPLSIKGKERVCGLIATLVVATRRECCSHRVGLFFQILFLDCCFFPLLFTSCTCCISCTSFPISTGMSSHFKFKDYAPLAFRNLRNFWNLDKYEYLYSICNPDTNFINFISNSKSGMYFFYSQDRKYMIKTLKEDECKFLRRILPHYVRHMTKYPNSLINRYYGLHRVKMPHLRRKIHFVVMNNIFLTPKPIHTKYDLKGATYSGRYVKMTKITKKSQHGQDIVRKDLNFHGYTSDKKPGSNKIKDQPDPNCRQWLKIGDPKRKMILADQIAADSVFLARMKIMDYSLLVGVHGRDPVKVPGYIPPKLSDEEEEEEDSEDEEDGEEGEEREEGDDMERKEMEYNYRSDDEEDDVDSYDGSELDASHNTSLNTSLGTLQEEEEEFKSDRELEQDLNLVDTVEDLKIQHHHLREQSSGYGDEPTSTLPAAYRKGGMPLVQSESVLDEREEVEEDSSDASSGASGASGGEGEGKDEKDTEKDTETPNAFIPLSLFEREDGGFWGMNPDGTPNNEIYYLGIIDILQQYNMVKFGENKFKSWFTSAGSSKISALPPKKYARRFIEYCTDSIK